MPVAGSGIAQGATNGPNPNTGASGSGQNGSGDLSGPWRVGRTVGRTVYRQTGNDPAKGDELIGLMDTPELARQVVGAVNARCVSEDDDTLKAVADALAGVDGWEIRWPRDGEESEEMLVRYLALARAAVRALREET